MIKKLSVVAVVLSGLAAGSFALYTEPGRVSDPEAAPLNQVSAVLLDANSGRVLETFSGETNQLPDWVEMNQFPDWIVLPAG